MERRKRRRRANLSSRSHGVIGRWHAVSVHGKGGRRVGELDGAPVLCADLLVGGIRAGRRLIGCHGCCCCYCPRCCAASGSESCWSAVSGVSVAESTQMSVGAYPQQVERIWGWVPASDGWTEQTQVVQRAMMMTQFARLQTLVLSARAPWR
jgi:hypothetical protein